MSTEISVEREPGTTDRPADAAFFEHHHPRTRILHGHGIHRQLGTLLTDLAAPTVFVVCGRTVGRGPQLSALRETLGDRIVGVFDGVRPQGGRSNLDEAARMLADSGARAAVSVGGGAAIDTAKYLVLVNSAEGPLEDYAVPKGKGRDGSPARALRSVSHVHVAVPTTAGSSSEIMPWAGVRDEEKGEKILFRDPLLVPDVALLDPLMVVPTGPELTATSGVTALARAVEALYSAVRQPIADAYALQAARLLGPALPAAIADGADLEARSATQLGALLSGIAADNAMVSLTHAIGHAVGGRFALQHGIAHRIVLPRAAARLLPAAGPNLAHLAAALGAAPAPDLQEAAENVAARLGELLASMPVPSRLRDVGVQQSELADLAMVAMHEPMMAFAPRELSLDEVLELLRECW
jgi:alcohol dehydrogenase class IV